MQEEMERKTVAISVKAGKLTADLLKKAITKALAEMEKSQKNPKIYRGKQSVKHLVRQGAGVSNIEVTDGNIKSFERVARKYGVDFALKKDTTSQPAPLSGVLQVKGRGRADCCLCGILRQGSQASDPGQTLHSPPACAASGSR